MSTGRPFGTDREPWWKTEDGACLTIVVGTCVAGWLVPDRCVVSFLSLLALGLFLDFMSLSCHLYTLVPGRYESGFPLLGLLFYVWFVLAYRKSLVAPEETDLRYLFLYKLLD